jgi:hypothetical protein
MKRQFEKIWIVLLGLAVMSGPALARDHGNDRDRDRDDRKEARDHDRHRRHGHGDRDDDDDDDRDGRPPGWRHGRKEGWKKSGCDLPPGLAKKDPDCGERRHHRDDDDRVVVSRTPAKAPARSRTTIGTPVRNTVPPTTTRSTQKIRNPAEMIKVPQQNKTTTTKKPTHKIRNPAEMIDTKTGTVVH